MLAQAVLAWHARRNGGEVGVELPRRRPTRVAHLSGEAGGVVGVVPQDLDPLRPAPGVRTAHTTTISSIDRVPKTQGTHDATQHLDAEGDASS